MYLTLVIRSGVYLNSASQVEKWFNTINSSGMKLIICAKFKGIFNIFYLNSNVEVPPISLLKYTLVDYLALE